MITPEDLYKQYSRKIFNLAYRMSGNRHDADDITQETFIQAFKNLDKFKGESHVYTWLYTIARNNCLQFLKNKKKSKFIEFEALIEKCSSPFTDEISEEEKSAYITQVKDGCLSGLLRCLSLQQRLAFVLNVLLKFSSNEVAVIMDISENAARILVHRAKQNLKSFLCNNCSLYNSVNPCRCENLINFSLKQNWISANPNLKTSEIESEIRDLKDVIKLFKTLSEHLPVENIQKIISQKENFQIFHDKKVK
jgi:RNA polymerase sigma-70 factor (ECF subfamily)